MSTFIYSLYQSFPDRLIVVRFAAKNFYQDQLGYLLGPVNWVAAVVFYLLYIVGIVVFAIHPGLIEGSLIKTVMLGALFGFLAYCTYELTNFALVKDWPLMVVWVDILWGTILTSAVAAGGFYLARMLVV